MSLWDFSIDRFCFVLRDKEYLMSHRVRQQKIGAKCYKFKSKTITFHFLQWEQYLYLFFCGCFCLKTHDDVAHDDTAELLRSPFVEVLLRSCFLLGYAGSTEVLLIILRSSSAAAAGLKCGWKTGGGLGDRVRVCVSATVHDWSGLFRLV